MKTNYTYWVDSGNISQNVNCDVFYKLINYCEAVKIPHEINTEISFKDNDEEKNEYKTLSIEECWLLTLLCKVLDN